LQHHRRANPGLQCQPDRPAHAAYRRQVGHPAATLSRRTATRKQQGHGGGGVRSWLVLLALVLAVASLSLGEHNPLVGLLLGAGEAARGATFSRPAAQPAMTSREHLEPALQSRLETAASVSRGRIGAYVLDLEGGGAAALDADGVFPSASLFKLPILVEVLVQQKRHELDPEQSLEV